MGKYSYTDYTAILAANAAMEAVTKSQNNIPRGLLPCLALGLHPLVVPGGGLLGLLEDHLGVLEHVTGLGLEGLGAEGDAAVDLVVIDDHALDLLSGLEIRRPKMSRSGLYGLRVDTRTSTDTTSD